LPPTSIVSDLAITAKDAEPLLEGLAERNRIPTIFAKLTSLDELRVRAKLRNRNGALDVMVDSLQSQLLDMSGRLSVENDESQLALLIGGDTVSVGIHQKGGRTDVEAFADARWLNEKLTHFPGPRDQVAPPKP
jgi:hypothetical protein